MAQRQIAARIMAPVRTDVAHFDKSNLIVCDIQKPRWQCVGPMPRAIMAVLPRAPGQPGADRGEVVLNLQPAWARKLDIGYSSGGARARNKQTAASQWSA